MSSENKMWDEAKSQYLHQVEKALASVKNSRKKEVLDDVRSHLERRFGELRPEQQNWENIQKIITDMGPPNDYAELMDTEKKPEKGKLPLSFVGAAIVIFAIIAGLMIIFPLIYRPEEEEYTLRESSVHALPHSFTNDPEILGEWESVDFVKFVNDFQPERRMWDGELFLKRIIFMAEGRCSKPWTWSKGWIYDNDDNIKAEYKIKEIAGQTYLFFPWLSGDVTIRGMKPSYYVLKKTAVKEVFEITAFDAAVQDFNIRPCVEAGLYNVIVTIVNKGTKTLPEFRLNFYCGEPAENLNLHGKVQTGSHGAGPIEPDEVWRESSMPFALNEGLNVVSVVLDIDNTVKEVDEGNNSAKLKILVENGKIIKQSPYHSKETNQ